MIQWKANNGGVLVLTLLVVMFLSILGFAILPLSVMEYKLSHNFLDFEKAYYIAEAGLEEAIAELNYNWNYSGVRNQNFYDGSYDIYVETKENARIIKVAGKIGSIQRTIEAQLEKPSSHFDFSKMKDFVIFSQGDLEIKELGNIHGGIVTTHGDLKYKTDKKDIDTSFLIKGEVFLNGKVLSEDQLAEKNFHFIRDRAFIDLSACDMERYIDWLKEEFPENVWEENNNLNGNKKLKLKNKGQFEALEDAPILIIENYEKVSLDGVFNGLIIVKNADSLKLHNKTIINGMIVFAGNKLKNTVVQLAGSKASINGSLICMTNSMIQEGNWKLELRHNPTILAYLKDYLPSNFKMPDESEQLINVSYWKEID